MMLAWGRAFGKGGALEPVEVKLVHNVSYPLLAALNIPQDILNKILGNERRKKMNKRTSQYKAA